MKTIVGYSDGSGARKWRLETPFKYLSRDGHAAYVSDRDISPEEINKADVIVLHNIVTKEGITEILAQRHESNFYKKLIVDVDDWFVTKDNPHYKTHEVLDAEHVITQTIKQADVVTCSTQYLADKLTEFNKNVVVLPNYYDPEEWDIKPIVNTSDYIRLGWAGSITHLKDLEMVAPAINSIMKQREDVKFIFCGEPRLKELLECKDRVEMFPPVPIKYWPQRLNSMALDIGIAPIVSNEFNKCKSNIKWMEYSLLKIPCVTSEDVYKDDSVCTARSGKNWEVILSDLIEYPQRRIAIAEENYKRAKKFNMKNHYKEWSEVYER